MLPSYLFIFLICIIKITFKIGFLFCSFVRTVAPPDILGVSDNKTSTNVYYLNVLMMYSNYRYYRINVIYSHEFIKRK